MLCCDLLHLHDCPHGCACSFLSLLTSRGAQRQIDTSLAQYSSQFFQRKGPLADFRPLASSHQPEFDHDAFLQMSLAQQAGATVSPGPGTSGKGSTPRVPINNLQEQGKLLASLQQFVESKGAEHRVLAIQIRCWAEPPQKPVS